MSLPISTITTNNVQLLDDLPNDNTGLTSAQLKATFDKFGTDWNAFYNTYIQPNTATLADIQGIVLGQLPSGGVTDDMLSNGSGQIKARFTSHLADSTAQLATKMPIVGGTFTGIVTAQSNTSYTVAQVQNIIEWDGTNTKPTPVNGAILVTYTP